MTQIERNQPIPFEPQPGDEAAMPKINRADLEQVHFTEEEIAQLTEDDLQKIAQIMRDHYIRDVYWDDLEYVTRHCLDEKQRRKPEPE